MPKPLASTERMAPWSHSSLFVWFKCTKKRRPRGGLVPNRAIVSGTSGWEISALGRRGTRSRGGQKGREQ
jgi:hypothetical protein